MSYGGAKFPELVVVLQGYGVTVYLHGETFISKAGITSSTFRQVPDVPITSFELKLPEGPFSALAANGNLCTTKLNHADSLHRTKRRDHQTVHPDHRHRLHQGKDQDQEAQGQESKQQAWGLALLAADYSVNAAGSSNSSLTRPRNIAAFAP